ncbi:hypothetical protein RhiirC2_866850 [Rhizophagus irregularis]|uniref:Uncharacterized protein n=1 Tax=Rhizophagus irregularis TaxID=588596 RepID=A0A2N1N5W9_9GLOM|nr:hypothetical protein RhiirC2_866850 [Rhizophagus irregularis]
MHSIDSLRELNAKLLAEIAELRKENAEIRVKNDELKDNAEVPNLRRKLAEFESEKVELKAKINELLRQAVEESKRRDVENAELKARIEELEKNKADSSAENVRHDDKIAELKAELFHLLSLAQLFDKATDAEGGAIRANQEEILRWYYYGKEFLIQASVIVQDGKGKIGEKRQRE